MPSAVFISVEAGLWLLRHAQHVLGILRAIAADSNADSPTIGTTLYEH